jgi:glycosyltransferase involved in cell wall biosynthesis
MVSSEHPDLDLVLVGNKTLRWASCWPDMEAWLTSRPEIAARVHVLNYVRDAWLPALYQGATINVVTPLWEGFGLTVLEAFASRTPVVTSRVASGAARATEFTWADTARGTLDGYRDACNLSI